MALWIPGFERVELGKKGYLYDRLAPKKLLLHSTEGSSIEGAISAYRKYPPHLICDYRTKRRIQHISLDKCSYSLKGSESDDEPAVQVEIVGFSHRAPDWPVEMLDWLCAEVFHPIRKLWPFDLKAPPQGFKSDRDGIALAVASSPIRFTRKEFEQFGGICAHQHVPPPDTHWDVPINIQYVLQKMKSLESGSKGKPMYGSIVAAYQVGGRMPSPKEVKAWMVEIKTKGYDVDKACDFIAYTVASGQ